MSSDIITVHWAAFESTGKAVLALPFVANQPCPQCVVKYRPYHSGSHVWVCVCVCVCVCSECVYIVCVCMYVCICFCNSVCMFVYVCLFVCVCVWTYFHQCKTIMSPSHSCVYLVSFAARFGCWGGFGTSFRARSVRIHTHRPQASGAWARRRRVHHPPQVRRDEAASCIIHVLIFVRKCI